MKIRNGFVSNSSSSSFVIAVKSDEFEVNVKEWLEVNKEKIQEFLDSDNRDNNWEDFEEEAMRYFGYFKKGMKLGDWTVSSQEFGSEGGDLLGNYIYCYGQIDTDNVKMQD